MLLNMNECYAHVEEYRALYISYMYDSFYIMIPYFVVVDEEEY